MPQEPHAIIMEHALAGSELRHTFFKEYTEKIVYAAQAIAIALARGNKLLLAGNGGSAADAQHMAAEFTNRFIMDRPPLPAIALTTDTSALTAIGNDFGFDHIFEKQVAALGREGDVFLAISTSGNSPNLIHALGKAKEKDIVTIGLTGEGGGEIAVLCHHLLMVPDNRTPLIQEIHLAVEHMLCQLTDYYLFEAVTELQPFLEEI